MDDLHNGNAPEGSALVWEQIQSESARLRAQLVLQQEQFAARHAQIEQMQRKLDGAQLWSKRSDPAGIGLATLQVERQMVSSITPLDAELILLLWQIYLEVVVVYSHKFHWRLVPSKTLLVPVIATHSCLHEAIRIETTFSPL